MKCCLYEQENQKEEIEKLEKRIDEIKNKKTGTTYNTYEDKPKLAAAIYFLCFTNLEKAMSIVCLRTSL